MRLCKRGGGRDSLWLRGQLHARLSVIAEGAEHRHIVADCRCAPRKDNSHQGVGAVYRHRRRRLLLPSVAQADARNARTVPRAQKTSERHRPRHRKAEPLPQRKRRPIHRIDYFCFFTQFTNRTQKSLLIHSSYNQRCHASRLSPGDVRRQVEQVHCAENDAQFQRDRPFAEERLRTRSR